MAELISSTRGDWRPITARRHWRYLGAVSPFNLHSRAPFISVHARPSSSYSSSGFHMLVARLDSAAASASWTCSPDVAPSRPLHCRRDAIADVRETSGEIRHHAHALRSLITAKIMIQCIICIYRVEHLKCYKVFSPKLDIVQKEVFDKMYRILREKRIINLEF